MNDVKNEVEKLKRLLKRDLKKGEPNDLFALSKRTAKQLAYRREILGRGVKLTEENTERLDADSLNEIVDRAVAINKAKASAGRRIDRYTSVMGRDAELDELFSEWLGVYAMLALLEEKALERYWFKFEQMCEQAMMNEAEIEAKGIMRESAEASKTNNTKEIGIPASMTGKA